MNALLKNKKALMLFLAVSLSAMPWQQASPPAKAISSLPNNALKADSTEARLSDADIARYRQIRNLQRFAKWQEADDVVAQVEDKTLLGYVLADRYTDRRYRSTAQELKDWLAAYADYPQAMEISALARKKGVGANALPLLARQAPLAGYGDNNGLASRGYRPALIDDSVWENREEAKLRWEQIEARIAAHDAQSAESDLFAATDEDLFTPAEADVLKWEIAEHYLAQGDASAAFRLSHAAGLRSGNMMPGIHWVAGISAWQLNRKGEAASHFSDMAASGALSAWEQSAAAYWAYRAYTALNRSDKAQAYLAQAAENPRTFYGLLAVKQTGKKVFDSPTALVSSQENIALIEDEPAVRRIRALVQIGETERAEKELRLIFTSMAKEQRKGLLALASELNLASAQISMASYLSKQGSKVERALYPMPDWELQSASMVDPALVYAFARQESGFRSEALGAGGAMGVMQLMPNTAKQMRKNLLEENTDAAEMISTEGALSAEANAMLGGYYLQHLLKTPVVNNNLIYLIASYNAGPGRVSEWRERSKAQNDPLLFLETMPVTATRHYVKQVMANYWIYQELRHENNTTAKALSANRWPVYQRPASQLSQK